MSSIHVEVSRDASDGLGRIFWRFWVDDRRNALRLVLDEYQIQNRKTHKHKYEAGKRWSRLYKRQSNLDRVDVYLPVDVLKEARDRLFGMIELEKEVT
jgi:tagatose-1,6-bisphosphate aldolase non-catalytic subunit AgaZ/GatZ